MSKKAIYICAVLQLQGIRKQPFEAGEVVVPENFPAEHFEKLIASGHIKEKPEEVSDEATVTETPEQKAEREAAEAKAAEEAAAKAKKK